MTGGSVRKKSSASERNWLSGPLTSNGAEMFTELHDTERVTDAPRSPRATRRGGPCPQRTHDVGKHARHEDLLVGHISSRPAVGATFVAVHVGRVDRTDDAEVAPPPPGARNISHGVGKILTLARSRPDDSS